MSHLFFTVSVFQSLALNVPPYGKLRIYAHQVTRWLTKRHQLIHLQPEICHMADVRFQDNNLCVRQEVTVPEDSGGLDPGIEQGEG